MLPQPPEGSWIWLAACWLAAWRVTALLCYEKGPFEIFLRFRRGAAMAGLERLVTCFHCLSVWVSAAIVLVIYDVEARSLLLILGVAGAASVTERFLGGDPTGQE